MEKLRIVIDPSQFPGKTEADIRIMLEDAEIVLVKGIDPIGTQVGELRILRPVLTNHGKAIINT